MSRPALTRRLNQALHELRRPVQTLGLRPDPPRELEAITNALDEIDRIVNGNRPRTGTAPAHATRLRLVAAIENMLVNALEHGAGPIEVSASPERGGTIVVRNRKRLAATKDPDPRKGHGLAVVQTAAATIGGRFELRDERAEVVALLELGPASPDQIDR